MSSSIVRPAAPSLGQLILGDGTPKRAFLTALVVGTILIGINQGDLILAGEAPSVLKIALTYCVPYCVTTWGAIGGKRAQWKKDQRKMVQDVSA